MSTITRSPSNTVRRKATNVLSQNGIKPMSSLSTKQKQDASTAEEAPSTPLSVAESRSDQDVGVLEITIRDGADIDCLQRGNKSYLSCALDGSVESTPPPAFFRRGQPGNPVWEHTIRFDVAPSDLTETSRKSMLALYDGDKGEVLGAAQLILPSDLSEEVQEHWLSLENAEGDMINGTVRALIKFTPKPKNSSTISYNDFEILKTIGRGNFGTVYKVRKKDTNKTYAMKVLNKSAIERNNTKGNVLSERKVLQHTRMHNSPFLVGLKFSFQTQSHLYFVMDYKSGGELFEHMQYEGGKFEESRVKFYIAEVLLAIETLHKHNIIYRDLKPENILLDEEGHIALCDFGLSRSLEGGKERAKSFCGTSEYLPPEVINDADTIGYDFKVDYWSLGILMFEMLAGFTPFYSEHRHDKFQKIVSASLKIPKRGISDDARDLLTRLLTRSPQDRIGAHGADEIKAHPFFAGLDWEALAARQIVPPFKPIVDDDDAVYIDRRSSATPGLSSGGSSDDSQRYTTSRRSSCTAPSTNDLTEEKKIDWWRDWTFAGDATSRRASSISQNSIHKGFHKSKLSDFLNMSTP